MIRRIIGVLLCCSVQVVASDAPPIGYLHIDVQAPVPLSPTTTTRLTTHLTNISDAPVLVDISALVYQPLFVTLMNVTSSFNPQAAIDAWGPATDESLTPDSTKIEVSGVGVVGTPEWLPTWPERTGIILLKDEGYARRITFHAGWIDGKDLPKAVRDWIVLCESPPIRAALPLREPGAVQPGKPVRFAPLEDVMVPGFRAVPFSRTAPKPEAMVPAALPLDASGLQLSIELPPAEAGKDLVATYLVGNLGKATVWIQPNSLVPAHATWELLRGDKSLATIDGSSQAPLAALLPERPAIPLNPGEYLTWRRVLLASSLPLKAGTTYTLRVKLDAPWTATAPEATTPVTTATLSGAVDFRVR